MNKFERKSGISKVLRTDAEVFQDLYGDILNSNVTKSYEVAKSPEWIEALGQINSFLREFVSEYGGEPIDVPAKNIHVIDRHNLPKSASDKTQEFNGLYSPESQAIFIFVDSSYSDLKAAIRVVHELLHFNSFQSIQNASRGKKFRFEKDEDDGGELVILGPRRIGFEIFSEKKNKIFFHNLNEAITEELMKRFDKRYFGRLALTKKEYEERELKRSEIAKKSAEDGNREIAADDLAVVRDFKTKDGPSIKLREGYAYSEERKELGSLVREIYVKNSDEFSSEEDVFKLFAEAVMTGRLLRIARIIERTFGEGSFKQFGVDTSINMTE
ncbi:MAG: hypothetical protein UW46_C0001G0133 [Candidatus Yanofskybacteria bacterium GW2011_GWF1_44_227]|uniref:Uncharacterized protein n=1 Tax=Candidatus Yanofskybacteria bacterium GW2011_GWE2_40_11 TaxID=1619033 RepID=A0A0G0QL74_9BACT|nr:MAG: hypothetical protein UT69_C0013G0062 [Candidatus Yanofskybacteria bacterium GW2011_GWE1_40_10]KKR41159.1 MAG: hypothetical protein UT75_C0001G0063 [Candidatus Yanofskybacteria bacterium GW2011_GWE2_40_11]KKT15844.1 MAG: hypothetical protein UV97_C0001G0017 [Candidatus Yanofskybacteria bacterium GW2011_GWF2_43_596]KKT53643.1 MAG: hypothetical protein UW46_C0001G0133 [Candidatus Yanofskybacteria bacterium GW2011_GWF1_44_227]OGN36233.1 MAG: hypothetical protein A2241_00610 [Candidatus Yano